jgi:hypothetical protein
MSGAIFAVAPTRIVETPNSRAAASAPSTFTAGA